MGDLVSDVKIDLFSHTFTNPLFTDQDKDGIEDAYESLQGLDTTLDDRELDPDADSLTNVEEFLYGTDADEADTDGDTLNDGFELENNRDPLRVEVDSFILGDRQLFLWLRAAAGVVEGTARRGYVESWEDQSGNKRDATQTNTNQQPTLVADQVNGFPVVRFDGINDRLRLADGLLRGLAEAELFAVLKAASAQPTSDKGLWRLGNASEGASKYPSTEGKISDSFGSDTARSATPLEAITQYHIYNVSSKPDEWINRINGTVLVESATNKVAWDSEPKLGRSPKTSFAGDFAELIMYEQVLSSEERDQVLTYLSDKYNIEVVHDRDGDGLPDQWEQRYFNNLAQGAEDDPDGDGVNNLDEYNAGTDPNDYYNGGLPRLSIVSGNHQSGDPGTYLAQALVVAVSDAEGHRLANVPVTFSLTAGAAQLAEDAQGTALGTRLNVSTDRRGEGSAFVLLGSNERETIELTARVSVGTEKTAVVFEASISSDKIVPGAVSATDDAQVHAKVNDAQGTLQAVIMSGTGEVQIEVPFAAKPPISFYSFTFRPSVGKNSAHPTQLNVAGAVLDFPRYPNAENIMSGYVRVLNGARKNNEWINTGIFYGLGPGGKAKVPLAFTLRLDREAGVWDLYIMDRLWEADIAYVTAEDKIVISLGSDFHTTLEDLVITKSNPLFEDSNKDGLPDSFEKKQGHTPTANNRQALIAGGTETLVEYYLNKW